MLTRLEQVGVRCPAVSPEAAARPPPVIGGDGKEKEVVAYPEYYLREYHAYSSGNLSWEAATEAEAMAISAAMVAYPEQGKDADRFMHDLAYQVLPERFLRKGATLPTTPGGTPLKVLDAGCGVGQSTFPLLDVLPEDAKVTAVDLSPHFLQVAKERDGTGRVDWQHCAIEALPRAWEDRYDLVTLIGVTHEMPKEIVSKSLLELNRVLKPGGTLLAMDVDPVRIRKMPSFVYIMFKSTEPDMDDYLTLDVPELVQRAGFDALKVDTTAVNRRVLVLGTKNGDHGGAFAVPNRSKL